VGSALGSGGGGGASFCGKWSENFFGSTEVVEVGAWVVHIEKGLLSVDWDEQGAVAGRRKAAFGGSGEGGLGWKMGLGTGKSVGSGMGWAMAAF